MLATSEAMLLGTTHGLSPQILAHILNTSTGKCWSSEVVRAAVGKLHREDYSFDVLTRPLYVSRIEQPLPWRPPWYRQVTASGERVRRRLCVQVGARGGRVN